MPAPLVVLCCLIYSAPVCVPSRSACGAFYDTVVCGKASLVGENILDEAVDAARQKHIGETACYWARKNLVSGISPLVGCTNALHGLQTKAKGLGAAQGGRVLAL
jgi:hypothetical protein